MYELSLHTVFSFDSKFMNLHTIFLFDSKLMSFHTTFSFDSKFMNLHTYFHFIPRKCVVVLRVEYLMNTRNREKIRHGDSENLGEH